MPFKESLACALQKRLGNLWKGDEDSDFTVVVEGTTFKCHRLILKTCSGFFQGLFNSQMKEQLENRATLVGISVGTFEVIINAMYTGVDGLNNDNVLDVWSATELLQIDYLIEECQDFVIRNIAVDSCFRFYNHATLYAAHTVVDHSLDFISRNFNDIIDEDNLLHLPFDSFYKVIANDNLQTYYEEPVLDVILDWVTYTPQSAQSASLDSGNDTEAIDDTIDEQPDCDPSTNNLSNSSNHGDIHDEQPIVLRDITIDKGDTSSQSMETKEEADRQAVTPVEFTNARKVVNKDESRQENRKQHLAQLLFACRLFTIQSGYLGNVMKKHIHLLVDTGAYTLLHEAMMYNVDVSRRHDVWPEAAVNRACSSRQHVMVFISQDKFKAYNLNTDNFKDFVELPELCKSTVNVNITVFDNILYLLSNTNVANRSDTKVLYMLTKEKTWVKVNSITAGYNMLLPHGNYVYICCYPESKSPSLQLHNVRKGLYSFCGDHGRDPRWYTCGQIEDNSDCLVRFRAYIIFFSTQYDIITAERYHIETEETHKCVTSMSGTSKDMVSFRNRGDVYIIQRNGSLWKVFSTDTDPVDFELVSKLWDCDYNLKGCVLYKNKLIIFSDQTTQTNFGPLINVLPGIFNNIVMIQINSATHCLPMILPQSWFTS
ncbi:hypothetical protein BsWGS_24342 [Bradybaena similaris]